MDDMIGLLIDAKHVYVDMLSTRIQAGSTLIAPCAPCPFCPLPLPPFRFLVIIIYYFCFYTVYTIFTINIAVMVFGGAFADNHMDWRRNATQLWGIPLRSSGELSMYAVVTRSPDDRATGGNRLQFFILKCFVLYVQAE